MVTEHRRHGQVSDLVVLRGFIETAANEDDRHVGMYRTVGGSARRRFICFEAGFDPKAFDLVLRGADGYSDSFPLSRALEDDVLLAVKMNGVPLPPDHGYPARVIVPGIYGMKNVKWLTGLELVPHDYKGHWQQQSWSDTALVKLSSRIDVPGDRELITTPRYAVKGIAFNGRTAIQTI